MYNSSEITHKAYTNACIPSVINDKNTATTLRLAAATSAPNKQRHIIEIGKIN